METAADDQAGSQKEDLTFSDSDADEAVAEATAVSAGAGVLSSFPSAPFPPTERAPASAPEPSGFRLDRVVGTTAAPFAATVAAPALVPSGTCACFTAVVCCVCVFLWGHAFSSWGPPVRATCYVAPRSLILFWRAVMCPGASWCQAAWSVAVPLSDGAWGFPRPSHFPRACGSGAIRSRKTTELCLRANPAPRLGAYLRAIGQGFVRPCPSFCDEVVRARCFCLHDVDGVLTRLVF